MWTTLNNANINDSVGPELRFDPKRLYNRPLVHKFDKAIVAIDQCNEGQKSKKS